MKFDIVRAWKDEAYRQHLSDEQRDRLPANPAGELSDAEMEMVYGGGGGMGSGGGGGAVTPAVPATHYIGHSYHHGGAVGVVSSSTAAAARSVTRTHSFGLLCDVSLFSVNLIQIPIIPIASPTSQCCSECD
jgi:mersacidin/lichenicidin family type 2 lantibiotic